MSIGEMERERGGRESGRKKGGRVVERRSRHST